MEAAKAAGVLRGIDAPTVEIAPGVTALHTPGHTPGHYAVRVASGGEEVHLLGDAVHHALQLTDTGISFLTDVDVEHALQTREELFARVAGTDVAIGNGPSSRPGLSADHRGRRPQVDRRLTETRACASRSWQVC